MHKTLRLLAARKCSLVFVAERVFDELRIGANGSDLSGSGVMHRLYTVMLGDCGVGDARRRHSARGFPPRLLAWRRYLSRPLCQVMPSWPAQPGCG